MNFSIIIPAKNEERNIDRCLQSILSIDWPRDDFEILVIDNGSSDRTAAIAESFGARVYVQPGATIAGLRNFGAEQAQGSVLVFMDADCTVASTWLQEAARYLDRQEVVGFGNPPIVPELSTWVQRAWFPVRQKAGTGDTTWLESMNMFVRREIFVQVGGFNKDLITCEDYDLSLRLKEFGRLVSDDRIIAVHHGEAATIPHFFRKESWRARSNFKGLGSHAFLWRELPSVLTPLIYCLLALMVVGVGVAGLLYFGDSTNSIAVVLLLCWQLPLGLLAAWKVRRSWSASGAIQLYILLNVYFLARGVAVLRLS